MEYAKTLFYNGQVITMDGVLSIAEAVAVKGDRIEAVGSREQLDGWVDPETVRVDLAGAALLPGFIDAHGHFLLNGLFRTCLVDLNSPPIGDLKTLENVLGALKNRAEETPEGESVIGFGFNELLLDKPVFPDRHILDKVSTRHPVVVLHMSGHLCATNTKAIESADMTSATVNPPGGVIEREADGYPSGVFEETAMWAIVDKDKLFDPEQFPESLKNGSEEYLAAGCTTAQEGACLDGFLDVFRMGLAEGLLKNRIQLLPLHDTNLEVYPSTVSGTPLTDDYMLSLGACKIINDGSPYGYTAYFSNPYYKPHPGRPLHSADYRGYPYMTADELKHLVTGIHKKGWQIAIHCNGDAASNDVIDAYETALKTFPRNDHRHILIHNQFAREDQMDRIKQLGLVPSFQITNNYYLGHIYRDLVAGPFRAERANPAGSAWRRGIPFTGHNDAFVTPIRPLLTIYEAVTRLTAAGDVLGEHQKVPVAEAVRSVTSYAAFQAFEENIKGSIEPGKLADFVVLDQSPFAVNPEEIKDLKIQATIVGGKVVSGVL